jgi:hypothetical protein
MPSCPQCNKPLIELTRQCPTCRADLDLLVEYVTGLEGSLSRAEQLTRAGELGPAVWAYLEVLEVDPDNPVARKRVGQVATAVRQFDRTAPGRRWAQGLSPTPDGDGAPLVTWLRRGVMAAAILLAFALGFMCANAWSNSPVQPSDKPPDNNKDFERPSNQMGPAQ